MSKVQLDKDETITDYRLGKKMFYRGVSFDACTTDEMRLGWNRAENFCGWGVYEESPVQAIRFSESALAAATKRPEYSFQGVDYTEPSIQ